MTRRAAALRQRRLALLGLACVGLAGCGFHLRHPPQYALARIAVSPQPGGSLTQALRQALAEALPNSAVGQAPQATLVVLSEQRDKRAVGLSTSGQVREYQLRLALQFRLVAADGQVLIPDNRIEQQRDFSYNESAALAKETEEGLLFQDMQSDLVAQVMRRLATLRPAQP